MSDTHPKIVPVFDKSQITARIEALAIDINAYYGDKPLVGICVLKGAFIFFSDLVRALNRPGMELDFVRLSSYGKNSVSSGHVRFGKDIEIDIRNKHVLIVEDIVDSGRSMRFLLNQFSVREPASLAIATLVDKHERREDDIEIKFRGFAIHKGFLIGYGLDYAEKYRSLPDICELVFSP